MVLWKQRLYAFLLRRILGPILDASSLQKLHESIEVSFNDGLFVLKDISLNTSYLQHVLLQRGLSSVRIRTTGIEKLEIQLTLRDHSDDDDIQSSSLAWRAMKFGTMASPGVSLIAKVQIDGVLLEVEPDHGVKGESIQQERYGKTEENSPHESQDENGDKPKGILSSYIDAALSSLRLTVQLNKLQIRICDGRFDNEKWLELRLQSAFYHDVENESSKPLSESTTAAATTSVEYATVMNKALDLNRVTVLAGENYFTDESSGEVQGRNPAFHSIIALLEGASQVRFRAIEYASPTGEGNGARIQQDIEVKLKNGLNLAVDKTSLLRMKSVVDSFQRIETRPSAALETAVSWKRAETVHDEEKDLSMLDDIMKQYQEAKRHAERNEVRGGILVPSTEKDDSTTFDTFFDANDQSFHHYSTVLQNSMARSLQDGSVADDFVHTKLRLHLPQGSVKVVLGSNSDPISSLQKWRQDEYILLTFNDVNMSVAVSLQSSQYEVSIMYLDIEDSHVEENQNRGRQSDLGSKRMEIESVLKFPQEFGEFETPDENNLLLQAPCLSVCVKKQKHGVEFDVTLEPLELTYRHKPISKMIDMMNAILSKDSGKMSTTSSSSSQSETENRLCLNVSCPSVTLNFPLLIEKDFNTLYNRCELLSNALAGTKSSLCILLDQICFESKFTGNHSDEIVHFSCCHVIVYATSPYGKHLIERRFRQFDIIGLSGRTEVNPYIPISLKVWRNNLGNEGSDCDENHGKRTFPNVPTISSFKARQEDEDEDNRVDRALASKMQGVHIGTRKELRDNDAHIAMLAEASKSDFVIDMQIPEIIGDISISELSTLNVMLQSLLPPPAQTTDSAPVMFNESSNSKRIGISCSCDGVSLTLHGTFESENDRKTELFSYMLKMNHFKSHFLLDNSRLQHTRVLSHDANFFEVANLGRKTESRASPLLAKQRLKILFDRSICSNASATPIIYRSHLFSPISRESPSILFDMINVEASSVTNDVIHRNVQVTIYDTTYRYCFEPGWIERIRSLFPRRDSNATSDQISALRADNKPHQILTRFFLSGADCNVDYSSPPRFKTASRMILRLGDFRLSSNIMSPAPSVQAYTISLGDTSVYICKDRYPYNFENEKLFGSPTQQTDNIDFSSPVTPDAVLKAMDFKTIAMLDSMDAVVAITNSSPRSAIDPKVRSNLTLGEVGIFACRDSFVLFTEAIGELSAEFTALDDKMLQDLKLRNQEPEVFYDSISGEDRNIDDGSSSKPRFYALDALKKQSALRPSAGTPRVSDRGDNFLLDGYDWTAIELDEPNDHGIPSGEDQAAKWYGADNYLSTEEEENAEVGFLAGHGISYNSRRRKRSKPGPRMITHHFPIVPVNDPLSDSDMDTTTYAGTESTPQLESRLLVHDLSINIRCFDGYDWPELLCPEVRSRLQKRGAFVIDGALAPDRTKENDDATEKKVDDYAKSEVSLEKKPDLLGDLLEGATENTNTFRDLPLPEERGALLKKQADLCQLARRSDKYLQLSVSGISLRLDSMQEASEHRLASCMNLKAQDLFLAETISSDGPIKMIGEWFNEKDHPRYSSDGLITMKMVTWHASSRVTPNNEVANDECEATLQVLPLRCLLEQRAIRFAQTFFTPEDDPADKTLPLGRYAVPPPLFRKFLVKPISLKVNYAPEKVDTKALRDGAFVELVNLTPIDDMVLELQQVDVDGVIGFGENISILISNWVKDICSTQLVKFLTNARPLEPITHIGGSATNMVVLPYQAFRNGESVGRAVRKSTSSLATALAFETFATSSNVSAYFAEVCSGNVLPSRPLAPPRGVSETIPHSLDSISRGIQEANYKVIIVPYREFRRSGASGAVKSVLKGIPVALVAPVSGAAEALSYTLLGARNTVRPDIRKEEEVSQRGLRLEK